MSLFTPHPCQNMKTKTQCEKYGKCNQFECEKFTTWFNEVYQQMMVINYMYDHGRVHIMQDEQENLKSKK